MLACERQNRLYIVIRMSRVWSMSSTLKCADLSMGKCVRKLGNHRWEDRRALIPERKKDRPRKAFYPFKIECHLLWIARLVEERRRILDQHLLNRRGQLGPGTRSERNAFDELLGGTGIIPSGNPFDHHINSLLHFP